MTALECLFVEGRAFQKGAAIADVLSKLVTVQGFDRDSQIEWVMALYRRRIDAVHEGSSVTEDLDALRLVQITKSVVHWAVHHLTPYLDPRTGMP